MSRIPIKKKKKKNTQQKFHVLFKHKRTLEITYSKLVPSIKKEAQRDEMTGPRLQDFPLSFVHRAASRVGGDQDSSQQFLSASPMSRKFL